MDVSSAIVASAACDETYGDSHNPHMATTPLLPEGVNIVGNHHGEETMPAMSPVHIQQEYFENLPDCDWIKYV